MLIHRERLRPSQPEHPHISGHRSWILGCGLSLIFTTVWYWFYQSQEPYHPRGGSFAGLVFGIGAALCMFLPSLFYQRKRFPGRIRLGRSQFWMKAHIWLGLLSLPLALFHSGFGLGGPLEFSLMLFVFVVWGSGVFGLILQQFLPSMLTKSLSVEAMAAYVDAVCLRLQQNADKAVLGLCGSLFEEQPAEKPGAESLRAFYLNTVRSFLDARPPREVRQSGLAGKASAEALFEAQKKGTSNKIDEILDLLNRLCHERRELLLQTRLHGWLHGWLWIHVPLSMTLLVLLAIHIGSVLMY